MREVWARVARTAGAQFYSLALGVLSMAVTTRLLGPEGRGQVAAVLAWATMFSTFGHLSLGLVAINRIGTRKDSESFGTLLGSLMWLAAMLSILGWIAAVVLSFSTKDGPFSDLPSTLLLVAFLFLPFLIWESYGSALLLAIERVDLQSKALMLGKTVSLILICILVGVASLGTVGAVLGTLVGQIVTSAIGVRSLLEKSASKPAFSWNETKNLLGSGLKLHINAVGSFLFSMPAGILIINHYRTAEEAGYYQLAAQLLGVIMVFPQAVSMVAYGKVSTLGPNKAWRINRSILIGSVLVAFASGSLAWLFAPIIVISIAGDAFAPSIEIFRELLPILFGTTLSASMAPQWIGRGLFWQTATLTMIVGIASVSVSLLLVPSYGVSGAVYASLIAYAIGATINIAFFFHCQRVSVRSAD